MNESPRVEHLHSRSRRQSRVLIAPNRSTRPQQNRRTQPFSRPLQICKYSLFQVLRLEPFPESGLLKILADFFFTCLQGLLQIDRHVSSLRNSPARATDQNHTQAREHCQGLENHPERYALHHLAIPICCSGRLGIRRVNAVPTPFLLDTVSDAPIVSTRLATIARPSPNPAGLCLRGASNCLNSSKIKSSCDCSIPIPESAIMTSARCRCTRQGLRFPRSP